MHLVVVGVAGKSFVINSHPVFLVVFIWYFFYWWFLFWYFIWFLTSTPSHLLFLFIYFFKLV